MVTVVPPSNDGWADIGNAFGSGLSQGYQKRHDEKALQKAVSDLPQDATPRQILDAVMGTKTYGKEAKESAIKNYTGAAEFEELKRKNKATEAIASSELEQKKLERQEKINDEKAKIKKEEGDTRQVLLDSGKYKAEEIEEKIKGGLTPTSARAISKPIEQPFEKESDKLAAKRTSEYIGEVETGAKSAQGDLIALNTLDSLGDIGATGFKVENAFADYLESKGYKNVEALRNPLSKAFNSVSKALMAGFGDIVKGKVSNFEFATFKGMLAQAEDSPQAAKAMIEAQRLIRQISITENELMQEIIKGFDAEGKSPPANLGFQVQQRLRPIADEMARQTNDKLRNILRPQEKIKNKALLDKLWDES